jgi:alkylation response protein AidB-like acyl-CoA dehydrogenase
VDALLDDTEQLLADSIAAQVAAAIPTTVSGLESFGDGAFWSQLATTELLGLGLPESSGGMGTVLDATIVLAALGRAVAPVPYLGAAVLPGQLLAAAGADPDSIAELVGGTRRFAVAFDAEVADLATTATASIAFDAAGCAVALAIEPGGDVVSVPIGADREAIDPTRRVADLGPGPRGERIGVLSAEARERWRAVALVAVAADLVGVMAGALDLAVEHAKTRVQFGAPIGRFQAVQHLVADAHVDVEGARSLVNHAAWAIDHLDLADALTAAHVAKAYCSEKGKLVCERVIQVHGGMGMTWECRAHLFHRRALLDRALLGDEAVHYRAIAARPAADDR